MEGATLRFEVDLRDLFVFGGRFLDRFGDRFGDGFGDRLGDSSCD